MQYTRDTELVRLVAEVRDGRLSRRQFVARALGLGLSASAVGGLLAACSSSGSSPGASPSPMATTKPAAISLHTWAQYLPPSVKKGFEKATGIEIVETFFDSNEMLLQDVQSGGTVYDVVVPSDYMVHIMSAGGLLEPLDMARIPNFRFTDERFKKPVFDDPDQSGGLKYSVPYQWGTTGYGVRTDKVDPATVGSWADLWDPRHKGDVAMLNDERECLGAALILSGVKATGKPYSVNTTDQAQIDAATQALIDQKPLVRRYDSVNVQQAMVGGVPLTMCWNGDALLAMTALGGGAKARGTLRFVLPREGFAWWVDNLAIPKGAPSPYGAHLFMDYVLDPKVMAAISSWTWFLPVEMEAAKKAGCEPLVFTTAPTAADMQRGQSYNDVGEFESRYAQAWAKVVNA